MEKFASPARSKAMKQLLPAVLLSLGVCGILLGICGAATEASPNQLPLGPQLSRAAANRFQSKLMEFSVVGPVKDNSLRPVVFTDDEVNSFIKYGRPEFLPPGVTGVALHFTPEGVEGAANVNFDELKPTQQLGDQLGARLLASIFKGTQHVTALGALETEDGTGSLTLKNVHIGNTILSDWLVNWLIQTYIQSQYKIDLSKPFLLPNHVIQIKFAPGKAVFVRGIKQKK